MDSFLVRQAVWSIVAKMRSFGFDLADASPEVLMTDPASLDASARSSAPTALEPHAKDAKTSGRRAPAKDRYLVMRDTAARFVP